MGAMLSRKVVVNLQTNSGPAKRRFEFRTGINGVGLDEVKSLMAERMFGPHAREVPSSLIRLTAVRPGGSKVVLAKLASIEDDMTITVEVLPRDAASHAMPPGAKSGHCCVVPGPPAPHDGAKAAAGGTAGAGDVAAGAGGGRPDPASPPRRQSRGESSCEVGAPESPRGDSRGAPGSGSGSGGGAGAGAGAGGGRGASGGPGSPVPTSAAKSGASRPALGTPQRSFVEASALGFTPEAERKAASRTSVARLPDDGGEGKSDADAFYNFVMAGDSGVGKSSLLLRFTKGRFSDTMTSTLGIDMRQATVQFDELRVKLRLWDSSGQAAFNHITKSYLKNAQGVLAVFDVTSRSSYERAQEWVKYVCDSVSFASGRSTVLLIGNKVDLPGRVVEKQEAHEWAMAHRLPYFETSAKDGEGTQAPFHFLGMRMTSVHPPAAAAVARAKASAREGRDSCIIL